MIDEKKLLDAIDKIPFQVEMSKQVNKTRPFVDIANVIECINNQPKVSEWIKCTDRLPTMEECQENDCRFIATDGNRTYERHFNYLDNNWLIIGDIAVAVDNCVKAWGPLPNRYKENDSTAAGDDKVSESTDHIMRRFMQRL